jgi:hypothetical protein
MKREVIRPMLASRQQHEFMDMLTALQLPPEEYHLMKVKEKEKEKEKAYIVYNQKQFVRLCIHTSIHTSYIHEHTYIIHTRAYIHHTYTSIHTAYTI